MASVDALLYAPIGLKGQEMDANEYIGTLTAMDAAERGRPKWD
jgi:hypothetical protein